MLPPRVFRLAAALLLLSVLPTACTHRLPRSSADLQRFDYQWPQMGAVFHLSFYAPDSALAGRAARRVMARMDSLEAVMSDYRPDSELMRLCNQAGPGKKVPVSRDLWRVLQISQRFARLSDGAFDISVGPLTRLWRRARHLQELPDSSKVNEARALVGWQNIRLYRRPYRVELRKPGMKLDLGGIGQGFAADECLNVLRTFGITRALADAGGDIALGDPPPDAVGWTVAIPERFSATPLLLARCGITSSGATARYLEAGGRRYSHIVDPRTGWGLTHRVLVTVQAPTATEADAWATAISVMGEIGWNSIKKQYPRLKVWAGDVPF